MKTSNLPDIHTDFAQWYQEVVYRAQLADQSPVRGCMVIRPYGYAIWEEIQTVLDKKIKETGHQNAYFPLLIPESFLNKEAEHVKGFAPEVAVVTHAGGKELEEPLVIRPTSETIIHSMFARWITSWRDLPLKINQWANVVRWEMRTRPFLRTTEFLWQEGHTAHETYEEAHAEMILMFEHYVDLAENYLAIPVITGRKPDSEKFAGADITMTLEGIMQDGKALQMCTSHMISQNFARAFNISFQNRNGELAHPYLTSWGATTRLIGALIMTHGDAKGLILPPRIAPIQVVIIPILKADSQEKVCAYAQELADVLKKAGVRVHLDLDDQKTPGAKFYEWELKGVPLRIEVGPRDLEQKQVVIVSRLTGKKEVILGDTLERIISQKIKEEQDALFARARDYRNKLWFKREKLSEFTQDLETKGGFYQTGWCGDETCEEKVKAAKGTIRCLLPEKEFAHCFSCQKSSINDIIIAKSY